MQQPLPINGRSPKKRSVIWIIIPIVLIVLGTIYWLNRPTITLLYLNYKLNKFKPGDKLYARPYIIHEKSKYGTYNVSLYQVVSPIEGQQADKNAKTHAFERGWQLSSDTLRKLKSAFIGFYNGYKIMDVKIGDTYFPTLFFVIKPVQKAMFKEQADFYKIPEGYQEAAGPFYIRAGDAVIKDATSFNITNVDK